MFSSVSSVVISLPHQTADMDMSTAYSFPPFPSTLQQQKNDNSELRYSQSLHTTPPPHMTGTLKQSVVDKSPKFLRQHLEQSLPVLSARSALPHSDHPLHERGEGGRGGAAGTCSDDLSPEYSDVLSPKYTEAPQNGPIPGQAGQIPQVVRLITVFGHGLGRVTCLG